MRKKQPVALGMEIYHGSFTLGVKRAGFKVLGHLETTNYAVKSAQLNHPDIDIRYNHEYGNLTDFFMADLIYSNPPCAVWSSASKHFTSGRVDGTVGKQAWRSDERLGIHLEIHETARSLQPKTFVIESITNAWNHGRDFWLERANEWSQVGYSVTVLVDNNMYLSHTSPQNRKRIFFVAHKYPLYFGDFVLPRTTKEVLSDIPKVPAAQKRWLKPFMRQLWELSPRVSGSLSRVVRDGLIDKPHGEHVPSFLCRRGKMEEPPNLYLSDSVRLHPTEPRYYDRSEVLALCGMPQDWKAATGWSLESMEMARCVLPGAGEYIASAVYQGLFDRPLKTPEYTILNWLDAYHPSNEPLLLV